jgi:hypothetical protein
VLVAIDAPLGWPAPLGDELADHRAGGRLRASADELFRRHTDREVAARLGKTPLDVGADRIARTAHAALSILEVIATAARRSEVPLLWTPARPPAVSAVEVYPAGLLVAGGFPVTRGYKPAKARPQRDEILEHLGSELTIDARAHEMARDDADVLDAMLCVLAGWDVLRNEAIGPRRGRERALAAREGWIWVRRSGRD